MKQSFRTTLVFAGVLVVLLAFYLIYDKKLQPKQEEAEEKSKQLLTLEDKDVQWMEIERLKPTTYVEGSKVAAPPEYEKFQLKKNGEEWTILSPVQDKADTAVVKGMVSSLTTAKQERVIDEKPKDLETFGLKTPKLKLSVRKEEKSPAQEIDIGKDTPVGFSSYAKTTGSEVVYKVARGLTSTFDKPLKDLRNKDIPDTARFDISEVDVKNPKESYVITKDAADNWTLARENIPADNTEWNKTLNAISDLKATDFAAETSDSLKTYGLAPAAYQVDLIRAKDKSKATLLFGKIKDKVYCKRADKATVYIVDKSILEKLDEPASKYRNLMLANFNRFNLDRVKIERGKDVLDLAKDKDKWSNASDPKAKIDAAKVDGLLTKLQDIKLTKYAPDDKTKLQNTDLVIRLFEKKDNTDKEKLTLSFGAAKGGQVMVQRSDINLPFFIKQEDFAKINLGEKDFLSAENKAGAPSSGPGGASNSSSPAKKAETKS